MRLLSTFCLLIILLSCDVSAPLVRVNKKNIAEVERPEYALVIHGGAGSILRENVSEEKELLIKSLLEKALREGERILKSGGMAIDAVEGAIKILEDSPHFNAGKGAVFTNAGTNELDASIMDGSNMQAGAVGGVRYVKNPISGARAVMDRSKHVFLTGAGADQFCKQVNLEIVDSSYFYTEKNWKYYQRLIKMGDVKKTVNKNDKHGTVGAVALDKYGNLAAGTSTGGMTNKKYNRIGDSPIIGAGTYANNKTCGVSCTGHGEYFIRYAVAHDISALIEYKGMDAEEAGHLIINKKLKNAGGSGGAIILDKDGNISMPFNTEGMYRGYIKPGEIEILMFKDNN